MHIIRSLWGKVQKGHCSFFVCKGPEANLVCDMPHTFPLPPLSLGVQGFLRRSPRHFQLALVHRSFVSPKQEGNLCPFTQVHHVPY